MMDLMPEVVDDQDVVRLWWWNPGRGATSQVVLREDLDELRAELDDEEYAETRGDTLAQLGEFEAQLRRQTAGALGEPFHRLLDRVEGTTGLCGDHGLWGREGHGAGKQRQKLCQDGSELARGLREGGSGRHLEWCDGTQTNPGLRFPVKESAPMVPEACSL
jgi:hypothetical protein